MKPIARAIARRLPPVFDAEDLEQEGHRALIAALAARDRSLPDAALIWYLKRRISGAMIDAVRGRVYRESTRPGIDQAQLADPHVERRLQLRLDLARMQGAVQALPVHLRTVVQLRYGGGGMTQREVGRVLGISHMTVCHRERQALSILRARLNPPLDFRRDRHSEGEVRSPADTRDCS